MTNTSNANIGWEVAGAKKLSLTKKVAQANGKPKANGKLTKEEAAKFPKIETLPPLKADATIYDLIRESDDGMDSDEINNNKNKQTKKPATSVNSTVPLNKVDSPKKASRKQQEPVNLLASNIVTNQKKKTTPGSPSAVKSVESELEKAMSELKLEEFEKEYNNLAALFPNNLLLIDQHLAAFLNQQLNHVPEFDPSSSHENESTFPMARLDKNVLKFLNGYVSKLNRTDAESLFEYCFKTLFSESPKTVSNHGYKIFIQLISKQMPNMSVANSTTKFNEIINANKHRHQRCLIALWSLGQLGYHNLSSGVKIWFDSMLPFMNIKGCTGFVATYLESIFKHSKSNTSQLNVSLEQYLRLFDLLNDKSLNLSKDQAAKLKSSFETLKLAFKNELLNSSSQTNIFENLLNSLPSEKSLKQTEFLELLSESLLKNSRNSFNKWKQTYSKNLAQSVTLLEHLAQNQMKHLKSSKDMRDAVRYFTEQTSFYLSKQTNQKEASNKSYHFNRSKTNKSTSELDLTKKFNALNKQLGKQYFKRTSVFSMVFRTLLMTALAVGIFFYWDVNLNKSIYTNSVQKQLQKYGLLDQTLKLIESVKNLLYTVQKLINYYVPIWYKKANETIVPIAQRGLELSKEYGNLVWIKSEPYRNLIVLYKNQGVEFVNENFPILVKNLVSVMQLAINYATTMLDFVLYYSSQLLDFVGVKLMGWKHGQLEKVFLDAFKVLLESLNKLLQNLNNYLNQN